MNKWIKWIAGIVLVLVCMIAVPQKEVAAAAPICKNVLHKKAPVSMRRVSNSATCTSAGIIKYQCVICKARGINSVKYIYQGAYGHSYGSNHSCIRCGKSMGGHWFKNQGGLHRCIVCSKMLTVNSVSPTMPYRSEYRVTPYDKPAAVSGNITVTLSDIPYDENGKIMTMKGIFTRYVARDNWYHWGMKLTEREYKDAYPYMYKGGKAMDERETYTYTASRSGTRFTISTPSSSGRYIFAMSINGSMYGGERRLVKGTPKGDDPASETTSYLTIKHINKTTGKEIVDASYTKTIEMNKSTNHIFSLPVGENNRYSYLANVSYSLNGGAEVKREDNGQYIVGVPYFENNGTIIFYYKEPKLTIRHVNESTGREILDPDAEKLIKMINPKTTTFSLDTNNKYPMLDLVGYQVDGEKRVNLTTRGQYIYRVPWNGKDRTITYYYKDRVPQLKLNVMHVDIETGKLMNNTGIQSYEEANFPSKVSSLDLSRYPKYENVGIYVDGKFTEKTGTKQYEEILNLKKENYDKTYEVIFYYAPVVEPFIYEYMDPIVHEIDPDQTAKIGSHEIGQEIYNVLQGIPTSENVYGSVRVRNYLIKYKYIKVRDISVKNITFSQAYTWAGGGTTVNTTYQLPVASMYYKLDYLEVYDVESASLVNTVLPDGRITLAPLKSTLPNIEYVVPETYVVNKNALSKTITLPTLNIAPEDKYIKSYVGSREYANFENTVMQVRNDKLVIDGFVITDSTIRNNEAAVPNKIVPSVMDVGILYRSGMTIDPNRVDNGEHISSGSVTYKKGKNIRGTSAERVTEPLKPNNVKVHTPVVSYTTLENGEALQNNQKINGPAISGSGKEAKILVLDKTFKVTIKNSGNHNFIQGYGNRTYNVNQGVYRKSYAKLKQIKIPFDVYLLEGNNKIFIPENTWYTLTTSKETFEFLVPVWVREGAYDGKGNEYYIQTRVIAENFKQDAKDMLGEEDYNASMDKYIAGKKIFVEVVGRLYDLQITGTDDPDWKLKQDINTSKIPVGQQGQNSITAYRNGLKLGYAFNFDLKTKGLKSQSIELVPTKFWFVSKDGQKQEVDLYYHSTTKKYIKIGSAEDKSSIKMSIKDSNRKVNMTEIIDSLRIWGNKYDYGNIRDIGSFAKITLPQNLRLSMNNLPNYMLQKFYGNKTESTFLAEITRSGVSKDDMTHATGHWYGEYKLPSSTLAVPKGTVFPSQITDSSSIFLKGGYILVQFDIRTGYESWDYLSYNNPTNNSQWSKEGYKQNVTLPNGKVVTIDGVGTVVVYESDLKASNDYESSGTH